MSKSKKDVKVMTEIGKRRAICTVLILGGFVGALSLSAWFLFLRRPVFLTTSSPNRTYLVKLKGDKRRAFLIPNQVSADVVKMGTVHVSDVHLHSAYDAFDLSFEAGFPEVRWVGQNVVEFYRSEYFDWGSDSLVFENKSTRNIKWILIQAVNKLLVFDLQPGTSVRLKIPAARGDWQWIGLEGGFDNGKAITFDSKAFDRTSTQKQHFTYQVSITDSGVVISESNYEKEV